MQRVLLGESQKSVAFSCGLAISTVAGLLRGLLSEMRVPVPASRVPLALVMLAHAAYRRGGGILEARADRLDGGRVRVRVLGCERRFVGVFRALGVSGRVDLLRAATLPVLSSCSD